MAYPTRTLIRVQSLPSALERAESGQKKQRIAASNGVVGDDFGSAIAVDGSRMAVGAYRHRHNNSFSGAAYIYELTGTTWGNEQYLSNED